MPHSVLHIQRLSSSQYAGDIGGLARYTEQLCHEIIEQLRGGGEAVLVDGSTFLGHYELVRGSSSNIADRIRFVPKAVPPPPPEPHHGFHYLLVVPLSKPASPGGSPRFVCCFQTPETGHAPVCTEARRRQVIEDALRRVGVVSVPLPNPPEPVPVPPPTVEEPNRATH